MNVKSYVARALWCAVTVCQAAQHVNFRVDQRATPLAVAYQLAVAQKSSYEAVSFKLVKTLCRYSQKRRVDPTVILSSQSSFERNVLSLINDVLVSDKLKQQFRASYCTQYATNEEYWHALRDFKQVLKTYRRYFMRTPTVDGERPEVINVLWEFNATMLGAVEISWSMWAQGLTDDTVAEIAREHWQRNVVVAGVLTAAAFAAKKYAPELFEYFGGDKNPDKGDKKPVQLPSFPRKPLTEAQKTSDDGSDTAPGLVPGKQGAGQGNGSIEQQLGERAQDQGTGSGGEQGDSAALSSGDDVYFDVSNDGSDAGEEEGAQGDVKAEDTSNRAKTDIAELGQETGGDGVPHKKVRRESYDDLTVSVPSPDDDKKLLQSEGYVSASDSSADETERVQMEIEFVQEHLNDSRDSKTNISPTYKKALRDRLDELQRREEQGGAAQQVESLVVDRMQKEESERDELSKSTKDLGQQIEELKRQQSNKEISSRDFNKQVGDLQQQLIAKLSNNTNTNNDETENKD